MSDDAIREEIAFIRRAIEEGRGYAIHRSPDLIVWGVSVAIAYSGTYARVRGWWTVNPDWLWAICIALPWLYSLRGFWRRLFQSDSGTVVRSATRILPMVWFGCGIFLTTLALAVSYAGDMPQGWFNAVSAGAMGIAFFASSFVCNLAWMRWVAVAWWIGEIAAYALRHRPEVLVLSAVLMVALLVVPGLLLQIRPAAAA
jgi:hypothetical protein